MTAVVKGRVHERRKPHRGRPVARPPAPKESDWTEPLRTCVVTREQLPSSRVLRLSLVGDDVVAARSGGRGAYVSISRQALEQLDAQGLSRALRHQLRVFDAPAFMAATHEVASKRVMEAVGLARRASAADFGVETIVDSPRRTDRAAVLVVATDLAERSVRDLASAMPETTMLNRFATGAELGRAAGMGFLGAALLHGGHLARDAAYWLSVWYETAPSALAGANEVAR